MASHSSTLAWTIPWTEEPGRLQSMGLWRVGHDWATSLSLFTFMHWRRKWQPTPVFLPGESQGRGSLVGCHLQGRTEWDTTEATWQQQQRDMCTGFSLETSSKPVPQGDLLLSYKCLAKRKLWASMNCYNSHLPIKVWCYHNWQRSGSFFVG